MKRIFVAEYHDPHHGWQLAEYCRVLASQAAMALTILQIDYPHLHFELGLALC